MALTKLSNIGKIIKGDNDNKIVFMAGKKFGDDLYKTEEQHLTEKIITKQLERLKILNGNEILTRALIKMPTSAYEQPKPSATFKLTEHLSLGLFNGRTEVMIDDRKFMMCKYLILNIPTDKVGKYDGIKSIDHLISKTGEENRHLKHRKLPSSKVRFWGHCSNFQVWVEHDYDTRLIDSRLALPILRKLKKLGDPIANRVYKEEILARLLEGYNDSFQRIRSMGFLQEFTVEELETLKSDLEERNTQYQAAEDLQRDIITKKRYIRLEQQRKRDQKEKRLRQERLEKMYKKQEANIRANERKVQRSLLYWIYDTPEAAVPHFTRAYREKRWLEQMLSRHTVVNIAKRANVSRQTIYNWVERHNISIMGIKKAVRLIRNRKIKFKKGSGVKNEKKRLFS